MRWILKADPVERKFFYPNRLINEMKVALGAGMMDDFDKQLRRAERNLLIAKINLVIAGVLTVINILVAIFR